MTALVPVSDFRAGAASCVCAPGAAAVVRAPLSRREVGLLGAGAAASVLSQALMFSLLPLVGRMLAPAPFLSSLPFISLFIGAVMATFPATLLTDAFGRRAAFALGASLGIAGGLVAAWGLIYGAFWPLTVGALWIGIANGFALQYRHAAAGPASHQQLAVIVGAGAVIGLVAPTLAGLAEWRLSPFLGAGTALLAAAAHVIALGTAVALPAGSSRPLSRSVEFAGRGRWFVPTAIAALAWFGMMGVMAFAPLGLAGCGFGLDATVGAVAWHLVAMYAPALLLARALDKIGETSVALTGLGLVALAAVASLAGQSATAIIIGLISAGAGWSIATTAAVAALHRNAPSRLGIAAHDATILAAGVGGALTAQFLG